MLLKFFIFQKYKKNCIFFFAKEYKKKYKKIFKKRSIREFDHLKDRSDYSIGVELIDSFRMEEDYILLYILHIILHILRRISQVSQKAQTRASKAVIFKKTLTDYVFKVIIEIYIFAKKN